MADVTVTNTKLTAFNSFKVLTANPATETKDNTAQKFVFTPTGKDNHAIILVSTSADDAANEILDVTVTGGEGVFALGTLTTTVPGVAGLYAFQIETGRYMQSDGTIEISFAPDKSSKDLATDFALKVYVIESLPN